jgi:alkylation response protein AidB-like acyl-CoA dehydrogenase
MDAALSAADYREGLRAWFAKHEAELARYRGLPPPGLEDAVAHELEFQRMLYRDGWSRQGWPVDQGGLGGSAALRGILYDEIYAAGYQLPESYDILETIGPLLERHAPELARKHLPSFLAGNELWTQGFSEPGAGSDLASLRTRAEVVEGGFRVTGQKVWNGFAHMAHFGAMLVRTGTPESRHRGLSMIWVDMHSPGVLARPLRSASGRNDLCEIFFDGAFVPSEHLIGPLNGGWGVAMDMLQFERGMYAWLRQARMHTRLDLALAAQGQGSAGSVDALAASVGDAYLALFALRAKCRDTVERLARGENPGPEISIDKVLLSAGEQAVFDSVRELLFPRFELDSSQEAEVWRGEWFFTRAASIYGGAVEVQRDIIGEKLLGLPKGRLGGG